MKHHTLTLTTLIALNLTVSVVQAGESVPVAKPPAAAPLPVPDVKLPVQFDLYIGPPSKEDAVKYDDVLKKDLRYGLHLPSKPFMFGFTLVDGQPIKPFSRLFSFYYEPAKYMDEVPDVGHCAYGSWPYTGVSALQHKDEFHTFTVERQGDTLRGSCQFTSTYENQGKVEIELKMTWTARIIGGTQVQGQAEVRWGEMVVTRPLTGIVRQGLDDLIDPLTCIYQFTDGKENAWAVVEVKDGKPVRSQGHVRGQSEIRLRKVNADSLRITRHAHGVNGWKADLEGSIGIEGGPTLSLDGVKLGVNGVGWGGHVVKVVKVRAYHPRHPVARDWEGLVTALFGQVTVQTNLAERARQQSLDLPALPPPGPAAKYHFKVRGEARYIYAPWLDFARVEGAGSYRFVATAEAPAKPLPIARIAPDDQYRPGKGVQATMLVPDTPPTAWLVSDMIPALVKTDPLTDLGGAGACRPESGSAFKVQGQEYRFSPMERRCFTPSGSVDLAALMKAETTIVLFAVWENAEVRHVRWLGASVGRGSVELVLAGRRVNPQQIIRLEKGYYPLLIIVRKWGAHFVPLHPILETVGDEEVRSLERAFAQPTPQVKTVSFVASRPSVSLSPIWRDMAVGGHTITLTALDAAGKPLGEPQSRAVVRKPSFGERRDTGAVLSPDQAEQAVLRTARVGTQRQFGLAPLWEHLAAQGIRMETVGFDRMPNLWLALAVAGKPGYERDLALAVAPHSGRWFDVKLPELPMGIPWSYGNRYWFAPMLWMPYRLDSCELLRDPATGGVNPYEASLTPSTPEMLRQMLQKLSRLQQPSGSWCGATVYEPYPLFSAFGSMHGSSSLDFNSASFVNMAGRLRRGYGCSGEALAMELKGQHWLDRNTLRTGSWENQEQQGSPGDHAGITPVSLQRYLNYQLEYALPQTADLDLAETLARLAEDCFMTWEAEPRISGHVGCGTGDNWTPLARHLLLLHQRTGDPLYLAKADAIFSQRLRQLDPVWGLTTLMLSHHGGAKSWDPLQALRYLDLRRQIAATPPSSTPDDPADAHLVLTLDRLLDRAERAVVHLTTRGGTVQRAFALTPSRQPVDVDFTQPGRFHVHADTVLHHAVEAQNLKVGKQGLSGQLTLRLAGEPKPLSVTVTLTPDYRVLRGTWTAGDQTGRAALEIRRDATGKPRRAHVEMCQAVAGGEPWQNWAAGLWNLNPEGGVASAWLGNNNAGWSAEVSESSLKLDAGQMEAVLKVEARWDGVGEDNREVAKMFGGWYPRNVGVPQDEPTARMDPNGDKMQALAKEWKEGRRALLANWEIGPFPRFPGYLAGFTPPPGYAPDNKLKYQTSFKPVMPGTYTHRFTGRRLGDVLAGTVTVKGPDGKEHTCQFLGGVE